MEHQKNTFTLASLLGIWFNWSGVWFEHWEANSLLTQCGAHSEFKWLTGMVDFLWHLGKTVVSGFSSNITLDLL